MGNYLVVFLSPPEVLGAIDEILERTYGLEKVGDVRP